MKTVTSIILAGCFSASLAAADIENGDELHFEHCTGCHDDSVYTRDNRLVGNLARLGAQVRFCKDSLGLTWFDDEVGDVIEFLNQNYYRF